MILKTIYRWLRTQEKTFIYNIRKDCHLDMFSYRMSFDKLENKHIDVQVGDRIYVLDGRDKRRHGSLIVKDVILKNETYGSETVEIKYAVFDVPINVGISAACNNDRALIVRTSETVVMLRKIINYVLNGESNV